MKPTDIHCISSASILILSSTPYLRLPSDLLTSGSLAKSQYICSFFQFHNHRPSHYSRCDTPKYLTGNTNREAPHYAFSLASCSCHLHSYTQPCSRSNFPLFVILFLELSPHSSTLFCSDSDKAHLLLLLLLLLKFTL